ncbi:unnamed protein product, partial [Medioppia subpectinata]
MDTRADTTAAQTTRLRALVLDTRLYALSVPKRTIAGHPIHSSNVDTNAVNTIADLKRRLFWPSITADPVASDVYLGHRLVADNQPIRVLRDKDFVVIGDRRWRQYYERRRGKQSANERPINGTKTAATGDSGSGVATCGQRAVTIGLAFKAERDRLADSVSMLDEKIELIQKSITISADTPTADQYVELSDGLNVVKMIGSVNRALVSLSDIGVADTPGMSSDETQMVGNLIQSSEMVRQSLAAIVDTWMAMKRVKKQHVLDVMIKMKKISECMEQLWNSKNFFKDIACIECQTLSAKDNCNDKCETNVPIVANVSSLSKQVPTYWPSVRLGGKWMCCLCDQLLPHWKAVQSHQKPLRCRGFGAMTVTDNNCSIVLHEWFEYLITETRVKTHSLATESPKANLQSDQSDTAMDFGKLSAAACPPLLPPPDTIRLKLLVFDAQLYIISLPKTREGYIGHVDADIHAEAIASTIPGMSAADIDTQALPIL